MTELIFILISFFACVIGSICGIGGGLIIKPTLDLFHAYSVATVSFMSGGIVLSMTAYAVIRSQLAGEGAIETGTTPWLGAGAALGGVAGKLAFDAVRAASPNADTVGAVQAACLFVVTLVTAIYTVSREKIPAHAVKSPALCVWIGLGLGVMSAFLGIGGGPMNLAALYFFFSMQTKTAVQNSLLIILMSQLASLAFTLLRGGAPDFPAALFAAMVLCGILGGAVGRRINKRIDGRTVDKLFLGLLCAILCVCCYNFVLFTR